MDCVAERSKAAPPLSFRESLASGFKLDLPSSSLDLLLPQRCKNHRRAVLGIEPRTSRTLNHATRPNSQLLRSCLQRTYVFDFELWPTQKDWKRLASLVLAPVLGDSVNEAFGAGQLLPAGSTFSAPDRNSVTLFSFRRFQA